MHSLIRAIPKTTYSTPTGTSASIDIVAVKLINTAAFVTAAVIARIHTFSASSWSVVVQNASFCEEEPNTTFSTSSSESVVTLPTSGNNLVVQAINAPISDYVRLIIRTPAAAGATVTISVDIVGRDA